MARAPDKIRVRFVLAGADVQRVARLAIDETVPGAARRALIRPQAE